jgi:hypothetical protein
MVDSSLARAALASSTRYKDGTMLDQRGQETKEKASEWKLTSNCTKAPGNPFFLSCLILTWQAPNWVNTDFRSSARVSVGTLVERLELL